MAFMYCKLFASLYQGTLRGKSHEILVFTNMLAHADSEGCVDKHFRAIADEVGLTVDEVKAAIAQLESPDPESRSPENEGRRIVRINDHRAWGWQLVNYAKYREIRNDADRREANRIAQAKWRERQKQKKSSKQDVMERNDESSASANGEGEEQEKGKEQGKEPIFRLEPVLSWSPSPEQAEVSSWFGRRPTTVWSAKELKAWKEVAKTFEFSGDEWEALKWYYTQSGCPYLRKDLGTLLNNWSGEIDRAKQYDPSKK